MNIRIEERLSIACGLCREACPEGAVHPKMQDIHHMYEDSEAECTGCGNCLRYCPVAGALAEYEATEFDHKFRFLKLRIIGLATLMLLSLSFVGLIAAAPDARRSRAPKRLVSVSPKPTKFPGRSRWRRS